MLKGTPRGAISCFLLLLGATFLGCDDDEQKETSGTPVDAVLAFEQAYVPPEEVGAGWSHTIDIHEDDSNVSLFCDGRNVDSAAIRDFEGRNLSAPEGQVPRSQFRQTFALLVPHKPDQLFEDLAACSPYQKIELSEYGDRSIALQMTDLANLRHQSTIVLVYRSGAIMMLNFDAYQGRNWSAAELERLTNAADQRFEEAVQAISGE